MSASLEVRQPSTNPRAALGAWMLVGLLALVGAGKAILSGTLDPDLFWHLRVGEQLQDDGVGPLVDDLSYSSRTQPWTPYSWLAELGMKRLWDATGWRGAVAGQAVLIAGFIAVIALACRAAKPRSNLAIVLAAMFAMMFSLAYLSYRPATLAMVMLGVIVWLIVRDRAQARLTRAVWWVVPITVLLANVHIFVFLAPLIVGAVVAAGIFSRFTLFLLHSLTPYAGSGLGRGAIDQSSKTPLPYPLPAYKERENEESRPTNRRSRPAHPIDPHRFRRDIFLFVATLFASLLTPMLPGLIDTALHYQFGDVMVAQSGIAELQPFWTGPMGKISLGLVGVLAIIVWRDRRNLDAGHWFLLAIGFVLLFRMGRFAPLFAILSVPILAKAMPRLSDRVLAKKPVLAILAIVLAMGTFRIAGAFPASDASFAKWINRFAPDVPPYPCAAADFIDAHGMPRSGRLINELNWGGYLAWRLGDHYQVLLDGRTQLFDSAFWQAAYFGQPQQRQALLDDADADYAILPADASAFAPTLVGLGWNTIYKDDQAIVMAPPGSKTSMKKSPKAAESLAGVAGE